MPNEARQPPAGPPMAENPNDEMLSTPPERAVA